MRSYHLLAIPLNLVFFLGGCSSGGSGLHNRGGATTAGGQSAADTRGSGGLSSASAGTTGGTTVLTSNPSLGGSAGAGGSSGPGGATKMGGSSAGPGGTTGGRSTSLSSSSATSSGGKAGTSSSSAAGVQGGNTSSGSSASTIRTADAAVGDGGIVASGYCEGDAPKLTTQGQTLTPAVTDYTSNVVMDCCNGYGVNLHTTASLGFDIAIELILSIDIYRPGEFDVGANTYRTQAMVRKSSDALTSPLGGASAQGSLRVFAADASAGPELGLCLEVTDSTSNLWGTKIFVPRVKVGLYGSDKRFQIFLLKDSTLRAGAVSALPLDSLVLADYPTLHLGHIAYVEKATGKIGLNPGQKFGSSLRTSLKTPLDMPFVAVADGARIYLGSFTSAISSIAPTGPYVYTDEIMDNDLIVHAPVRGDDPRNDERILKALSERGKLVP